MFENIFQKLVQRCKKYFPPKNQQYEDESSSKMDSNMEDDELAVDVPQDDGFNRNKAANRGGPVRPGQAKPAAAGAKYNVSFFFSR